MSGLTELLACPFCGNTGQVFFHKVDAPDETGWSVACGGRPNCAASVGQHVSMSKAEAVAAWNRRALISRTPATGGKP